MLAKTLIALPMDQRGNVLQVLTVIIVLKIYRVDALQKPFINRLATAVAIPSVSADAAYRPEVHKMGKWLASELEALGVKYHRR